MTTSTSASAHAAASATSLPLPMNVAGSGLGRSCCIRSTTVAPAASASPASSSSECSASMRRVLAVTSPTRAARSDCEGGGVRRSAMRGAGLHGPSHRISPNLNVQSRRRPMTHFLQLLLLLTLVIAAAKLAGALANRVGQPAVFGEILAGLLLGPTFLDMLGWPIFHGELLALV